MDEENLKNISFGWFLGKDNVGGSVGCGGFCGYCGYGSFDPISLIVGVIIGDMYSIVWCRWQLSL